MEHRYTSGEYALTAKEYQKIIGACNTLEDEVMIKLAIGCGLRRVDITKAKIKDIDWVNERLSFHEHKKNRTWSVPLSPSLVQLLRKYIRTLPKGQTDILKFEGRQAYNRLQKLCDVAGIPRRPFHALRATCIKRCQAAGWTPEQVSALTGDTIRVIQQHYLTPSMQEMSEVVKDKEIL